VSSQTLSSKPKEEPAVVALRVVVHESTTKLTSVTGVMVHLFGGDVELVMIDYLDNILQKVKVIWKEVVQIHGENIMTETLGGDA
jgi:hypothetical protein